MYVKLTAKGINQFIDEDNTRKIKHIKDDFGAEIEVDKAGNIKRYSADDVRKYVGKSTTKETPEAIFGVKTPAANTVTGDKGVN